MVSVLAVFFISLIVCYGKACLKINGTTSNAEGSLQEIELTRYTPPTLKSLIVHPDSTDNYFDFVLDTREEEVEDAQELEPLAKELIDYFFLGITLPSDDLWVNLNSVQESEVTSPRLALTDIGKVLLEADLTLKRDCSRFNDPRTKTGKQYWDNLQRRLNEEGLNTTQLPIGNRFWIIPEEAIVEEDRDNHTVTIVSSKLKVCLEQEYLKLNPHNHKLTASTPQTPQELLTQQICDYTMKESILPHIQERVNHAQEYAKLRQVYNSLILAEYYKQRYHNGIGLYPTLINQAHIQGLESSLPWNTQDFYQAYVKSAQEGEYRFSSQEYDPYLASMVKKYYFYGGITFVQHIAPKLKVIPKITSYMRGVLVKVFRKTKDPWKKLLSCLPVKDASSEAILAFANNTDSPEQVRKYLSTWTRSGHVGLGGDNTKEKNEPLWCGIPTNEIKTLLYPASGNDSHTVIDILAELPNITDVHLVDNCSQYSVFAIMSRFNKYLQTLLGCSLVSHSDNLRKSTSQFVFTPIPSAKDQNYFWLTLRHNKTRRKITVHLHKHNYLTLDKVRGLAKGADLTIVKFAGLEGELTKLERNNIPFYSRVHSHTRSGGYIYLTQATPPLDESMQKKLEIVDSSLGKVRWIDLIVSTYLLPDITQHDYLVCKKVDQLRGQAEFAGSSEGESKQAIRPSGITKVFLNGKEASAQEIKRKIKECIEISDKDDVIFNALIQNDNLYIGVTPGHINGVKQRHWPNITEPGSLDSEDVIIGEITSSSIDLEHQYWMKSNLSLKEKERFGDIFKRFTRYCANNQILPGSFKFSTKTKELFERVKAFETLPQTIGELARLPLSNETSGQAEFAGQSRSDQGGQAGPNDSQDGPLAPSVRGKQAIPQSVIDYFKKDYDSLEILADIQDEKIDFETRTLFDNKRSFKPIRVLFVEPYIKDIPGSKRICILDAETNHIMGVAVLINDRRSGDPNRLIASRLNIAPAFLGQALMQRAITLLVIKYEQPLIIISPATRRGPVGVEPVSKMFERFLQDKRLNVKKINSEALGDGAYDYEVQRSEGYLKDRDHYFGQDRFAGPHGPQDGWPGQGNKVEKDDFTLVMEAAREATALYETPDSELKHLMEIADRYHGAYSDAFGDLVFYRGQGILIFGKSYAGKTKLAYQLIQAGAKFGGSDAIDVLRVGTTLIGGVSNWETTNDGVKTKEAPLKYRPKESPIKTQPKEIIKPTQLFVPISAVVFLEPAKDIVEAKEHTTHRSLQNTPYIFQDLKGQVFIPTMLTVDLPIKTSDGQMKPVAKKILARVRLGKAAEFTRNILIEQAKAVERRPYGYRTHAFLLNYILNSIGIKSSIVKLQEPEAKAHLPRPHYCIKIAETNVYVDSYPEGSRLPSKLSDKVLVLFPGDSGYDNYRMGEEKNIELYGPRITSEEDIMSQERRLYSETSAIKEACRVQIEAFIKENRELSGDGQAEVARRSGSDQDGPAGPEEGEGPEPIGHPPKVPVDPKSKNSGLGDVSGIDFRTIEIKKDE